VRRNADPRDRRSKVIVATEAGHRLFAQARDATEAAERDALRALNTEEQATLRQLLGRIAFEAGPSKP
jgi:DNA-binding MarR family transcriptional regulator